VINTGLAPLKSACSYAMYHPSYARSHSRSHSAQGLLMLVELDTT
jgi:hypothetical protein